MKRIGQWFKIIQIMTSTVKIFIRRLIPDPIFLEIITLKILSYRFSYKPGLWQEQMGFLTNISVVTMPFAHKMNTDISK